MNAPTKELDKGRGAMTTSIKTLPTLVPFVMCFNCSDIRIKPSVIPQLKKMEKSEKEKLQSFHEEVNNNIVEGKSVIIVQLKTKFYLYQIMKIEKLKKIPEGYFFYSNNRKLLLSSKLDKGNHFIHFYSKILGGTKVNWWELLLQIKPQIETIGETDIQIYTKRMRNSLKENTINIGS
jgi:mRNA-degrading endonuclease RelE of RelBE toxin-antitoxin system